MVHNNDHKHVEQEPDEETLELIALGLDAQLSPEQMRRLYRATAANPLPTAQAMGEMADLEEALDDLRAQAQQARPATDLAQRIETALAAQTVARPAGVLQRLFDWLRHPQGLSIQPMSFIGGGAVAALALTLAAPVVIQQTGITESPRLEVSEVSFEEARTRDVDWTSRFIVFPGQSMRLDLNAEGDRPMVLQFEAAQPTPIMVQHEAPGARRDAARALVVNGIHYVTLRNPQPGDRVAIRNRGEAPVLVYAQSSGAQTSIAEDGSQHL
ncbi:hypothetical protein [Magnetofaba australis]|uniref:Uncharacterized protein n=1 Tax=Magnetofaba australis IT-1 TaxID=1434232 RepID=A0A1Y2K0W4_9PROT|nr:hypothetical protein [Magnetofaba australis]OSM01690.1 hypothetical protein MAIT1_01710 [Magnetofaba australis IT-1]